MPFWFIILGFLFKLFVAYNADLSPENYPFPAKNAEAIRQLMYEDDVLCEQKAVENPVYASLAQEILAEKLKWPVMATLPFHYDYTIFYGLEFPDFLTALPFLFEGAAYLYHSESHEDMPGSLLFLVCEEFLRLLVADRVNFDELFDSIFLDRSYTRFLEYYFRYILEEGRIASANKLALSLPAEKLQYPLDHWIEHATPAVISFFASNPETFFHIYKKKLTPVGLHIALAVGDPIFNQILRNPAKFDAYGPLKRLLEEIDQDKLMQPVIINRILALFNTAPRDDYYLMPLFQNLFLRRLITVTDVRDLGQFSIHAAYAALKAGNFVFFLESFRTISYLNRRQIDLKCPHLLAYLRENIQDPHSRYFIKEYSSILHDESFLLAFYGFDSMQVLLNYGSKEAINSASRVIAERGSLRLFSHFRNISTVNQFEHLFSRFIDYSTHSDEDFETILRYFLCNATYLLNDRAMLEIRPFLSPKRFIKILENEQLCHDLLHNPLVLTNSFKVFDLHKLALRDDNIYRVLEQYKPLVLKFVTAIERSFILVLTPFELKRLLQITDYSPSVYCRRNLLSYISQGGSYNFVMSFRVYMMHYMRTWYEDNRSDALELIGQDNTPLASLICGKKDTDYVARIIGGMSENVKLHLRNLLLLSRHPELAPENPGVEEDDDEAESENEVEDESENEVEPEAAVDSESEAEIGHDIASDFSDFDEGGSIEFEGD